MIKNMEREEPIQSITRAEFEAKAAWEELQKTS